MGEAKVEESLQVDGGASVGESDAVWVDAAVADFAAATSDEPGDGAFDHRAVLAVGLGECGGVGVGSGGGEKLVVRVDFHGATIDGGGASLAERAAPALRSEGGVAVHADPGRDPVRTSDGHRGAVADEVIDAEPAGDGRFERDRLDRRCVAVIAKVVAELAGSEGRIGEHLDRCGLVGEQTGRGLSVTDVAGRQLHKR